MLVWHCLCKDVLFFFFPVEVNLFFFPSPLHFHSIYLHLSARVSQADHEMCYSFAVSTTDVSGWLPDADCKQQKNSLVR